MDFGSDGSIARAKDPKGQRALVFVDQFKKLLLGDAITA
jgi:hypothetical protein